MIRVFLVDDHPIVRQGLRTLVEGDPGLSVVGEAGDLPTARQRITELCPDVAVVDLKLGEHSGLDVIQHCRSMKPAPGCVVLTMHREESTFDAALNRGAGGYVLKENASDDILLAIRAVATGGFFLSNSLREFLIRRDTQGTAAPPPSRLSVLTPTERRVLRLIGANRTTKEIAHELCVSPRTVDTHRAKICERLGLRGAQALLRFALENRTEL